MDQSQNQNHEAIMTVRLQAIKSAFKEDAAYITRTASMIGCSVDTLYKALVVQQDEPMTMYMFNELLHNGHTPEQLDNILTACIKDNTPQPLAMAFYETR